MNNNLTRWLILPIILYIFFSATMVFVQRPHEDEMVQSNVAVNLLKHGFMGIPQANTVVPYVPWWKGIDKHFYGQPPLSILAQVILYKIFGIGLFQLRFLGVFFGLIGLLALASILRRFNATNKIIILALTLISVDFIYTRFSAHGRLFDVMCAALAFASWASYLSLREKSFPMALLVSNTLIAMSGLTHPNGIIGWAGLLFLILYHDMKRISLKHILISFLPYLIGSISWGLYILQDWDAFYHQFFGIAFGKHYTSYTGISWRTVYLEIVNKYLFAYGFSSQFPIFGRVLLFILFVYFFSYVSLFFISKNNYGARIIFILTTIYFFLFMFLSGHKWPAYLVHIVPLFASGVAILYSHLRKNTFIKRIFTIAIINVVILSCGVNLYRFKRDEYHKKYLPDINKILQISSPEDSFIAPWETSFHLGFERVIGDHTLGYFSKQQPNFIIADSVYDREFRNFQKTRPEIFKHINQLLNNDYQLVYIGNIYKLYKKVK